MAHLIGSILGRVEMFSLAIVFLSFLLVSVLVFILTAYRVPISLFLSQLPVIGSGKYQSPNSNKKESLRRFPSIAGLEIVIDHGGSESSTAEASGYKIGSIGKPGIVIDDTAFKSSKDYLALIPHEVTHIDRGDTLQDGFSVASMLGVYASGVALIIIFLASHLDNFPAISTRFLFILASIIIMCGLYIFRSYRTRSRMSEFDADEGAVRRLGTVKPLWELLETYKDDRKDKNDSEMWIKSWLSCFLGGETHPTPTNRQKKLREQFEIDDKADGIDDL